MALYQKGNIPWTKGKSHSYETRIKISASQIGKYLGVNAKNWKGGKPNCSDCKKPLGSYRAKFCTSCAHKGERNHFFGKKHTEESLKRISETGMARDVPLETRLKMGISHKKEKHWNWKGGIDYRDKSSLFNPLYVEWRTNIFKRDGWKCKIKNNDCSGQLEVHHILPWRDYPELRFKINNGITLCHAHHPRKRAKEKLLAPTFRELIGISIV